LASRGAGGAKCKLTVPQLRELGTVLDAGPAAWGWDEDQCWTLARIAGSSAAGSAWTARWPGWIRGALSLATGRTTLLRRSSAPTATRPTR
jgi:hypothetical protein